MPAYKFITEPTVELRPAGAKISWETDCEGGGQILLGPDDHDLKTLVYDGLEERAHSIEVKNLQPGRTYFFRVSNVDDGGTPMIQSKVGSFTVPAA